MADLAPSRTRLALHGGTPVLREPHVPVWPRIEQRHVQAVADVIQRGEVSYFGREGLVRDLEDFWSARLGGRPTLAVTSGTGALHSGFYALGAQAGDEVIGPTYTFLATVMPLVQLGVTPVLADAEKDTGNLDPVSVEAAITPKTVGIVATHMWGHPCDMAPLRDVARRHNLWILEDASHAHGATYRGEEVGTFGDAAAFSFQAAKIVFAGQGGLLASATNATHERAVLMGHFMVRAVQDGGELARYASTGFGLNYRMHPAAAALAVLSSADLEKHIESRTRLHAKLSGLLDEIPGITPPVTRPDCTRGAFYGYKVHLGEQWTAVGVGAVIKALRAEGISVSQPGTKPLHTLPFFTDNEVPVWTRGSAARRVYRKGDLPASEEIWASSLKLPTFTFDDEEPLIDAYAEAFTKVYGNLGALRDARGDES